jgi:Zn-dependent oligopeptidase
VQFYEISRGTEKLGRLFFDVFARPGKASGNFMSAELRGLGGVSLPSLGVVTTFPGPSRPGRPRS